MARAFTGGWEKAVQELFERDRRQVSYARELLLLFQPDTLLQEPVLGDGMSGNVALFKSWVRN